MCVNCTQTGTGEKNPIFDILYKILKVVVYVFKFQNISFTLTFFKEDRKRKESVGELPLIEPMEKMMKTQGNC